MMGAGGPFQSWDSCTRAWRSSRLVRPRAHARSRRDRSLGRREAPSLDRLIHTASDRPRSCAATPSGTTSRRRCRRRRRILRAAQIAIRAARPTYVTSTPACRNENRALSAASRREAIPRARPGAASRAPRRRGGETSCRREASCDPRRTRFQERVELEASASRSPKRSTRASSPTSQGRRGFPTDHALQPARRDLPFARRGEIAAPRADVVLSLDWVDLAGALKASLGHGPVGAR